ALRDMLQAGMSPKDVRAALLRIVDTTYTYYIPDDLGYARTRSRVRGDRSIHLTSVLLGSALDIKPIIRGYQGDTHPVSKYRGRAQAWASCSGTPRAGWPKASCTPRAGSPPTPGRWSNSTGPGNWASCARPASAPASPCTYCR